MSTKYRYNSFNEYAAQVATKLPSWHPFRSNPNSNWRKLLTPVFGDMLVTLNDANNIYSQDLFLASVNTEQPDTLYSSALNADTLVDFDNLLINSDFSQTVIDGYLNWATGLTTFTQYTDIRVNANQALNLLVDTTTITQVDINGIRLDTGAPVVYTYVAFTSVNTIQETYALEITSVVCTGTIGTSTLMLWHGDANKVWTRNEADTTYWLNNQNASSYKLIGDDRPIFEASSFTDMFQRTPATFASMNPTPIADDIQLNSGRQFLESKIEFHGDRYPSYLDVDNFQIRKLIDKSVEYTYDLHELKANGLIAVTNYIIDAIYLGDDVIIALARVETAPLVYDYYLLWVSPDHLTPEDGILQVIKSIPIDTSGLLDGDIALYTKSNDPYSLVISNTTISDTFLYEVDLKYDYYVVDLSGGELSFRESYTTMIGLSDYSPTYAPYHNSVDEHGLFRGLPRIRYEKNYDYKLRTLDYSNKFRTNSSFTGLSNGINIRLGYKILEDILTFPDNLNIVKIDDTIYISNPTTTAVETLARDANYQRAYLAQTPHIVNSVTIDGELWPTSLYKIAAGSNEIIFSNYPDIGDSAVIVVNYIPYTTVFYLGTSSIKDLYDSLVADGVNVETLYLTSLLEQIPASHIMDIAESGIDISLTYYPIRVENLGLEKLAAFQDLSISKYELTDLQSKVIELANTMHDSWNKTILDRDRWDMVTNNQIGGGILPAYHDGMFSWFENAGALYGHVNKPINSNKEGFELEWIQNGTNSTLDELEKYKDLELIGFTDDYEPKVRTGFFYIKEMQFYLFANKQRVNIPEALAYLVDMDAIRTANPTVEYTGFNLFTPNYNGADLYVFDSELATAEVVGFDTVSLLTVNTPVSGFEGTDRYYFFEAFKEGAPIILTDLGAGLQEVQFSATSAGLVQLLTPGAVDTPLFIEYEPYDSEDFSILNVDASFDRGYLYLELDGTYSDLVTAATNFGLVNGPSKGTCRVVFDPDEGLSAGIDYEPGQIIETSNTAIIADPAGPASLVNPNLYYGAPIGWGHDWGVSFGN